MTHSPVLHNQQALNDWLDLRGYAFLPQEGNVEEKFPCIAVVSIFDDLRKDAHGVLRIVGCLTCVALADFEWKNGILINRRNEENWAFNAAGSITHNLMEKGSK